MKKIIYLFVISVFITGVQTSSAQTIYSSYRDGQLYLKFKNEITFSLPDYDINHPSAYPETFSTLIQQYGIYSIHKAFPLLKSTELIHSYKVLFHAKAQVDQLIKALQNIPGVEYAERIPIRRIELTPNDPGTGSQFALNTIDAYNAWNLSTGSISVKLAIVDDEVRLDHEDLSANRWINPGEIPNNLIDDDANGYVDDVNGFDVADGDGDPSPPPTVTNTFQTHGTHCAGIADGVSNNGLGIASVGFGLSLVAVKCNPDTITSPTEIQYAMDGVQYAIAAHADVISMSWGGDGYSITDQHVFDFGWAQGIIFVAAAGNNSTSQIFYPAGYNHIVSVGSTTNTDGISSFSNFGTWVTVMAPGSNIYSCKAGSNTSYGLLSGTSMAAPMVAGLCGLIKSYNPALTNSQIVSCLKSSCDNINALNTGYVNQLGAGRINALAALQCAAPLALPVADFTSINPVNCTGIVPFTDLSTSNPDQWLWNFGDGDTSTQQNPVHRYLASGLYNVVLTVSNANGSDSSVQNNYINITLPAPPVTTPASACSGTRVTLNSTGSDSLYWFTSSSGNVHVGTGPSYLTPLLNNNTSYYVESDVYAPVQSVGPPDSAFGSGGYFNGTNFHSLLFDCYAPATLFSVNVYAQDSGIRTISLLENGNIIQSATVDIPAGLQVVPLNFNIPAGNNLELGIADNVNLFRNNIGTVFPFTLPGVLSITGTNAGSTGYYYFFYDWKVQASPCISPRVPLLVTVTATPAAAFTVNALGDSVNFVDLSANATSLLWNFGDPASGVNDSSILFNPFHVFTADSTYNVCLIANPGATCTDTACQLMLIASARDLSSNEQVMSVFPNPANNLVTVAFNTDKSGDMLLEIFNDAGQLVHRLNKRVNQGHVDIQVPVAGYAEGIYKILLKTGDNMSATKLFISR